jgi:uncharacterized protein YndB with AHSA1/START domain
MPAAKNKTVDITREFRAPRELVFRAWTNPEMLAKWYAPNACELKIGHFDLRVGGTFHYRITHPFHGACWVVATFKEITAPSRLVFTLSLADEKGNPALGNEAHKAGEFPPETLVTLAFTEKGGVTSMRLQQTLDLELARNSGAYPSWLEMFDRLEALQAKEPTLEISREFDAPRDLVFRAWTDPALIQRWWGPAQFTSPAARTELREGGRFHFCMRAPDGKEYWNVGEYREVIAPARIVSVMWFSDPEGNKLPPSIHFGAGTDFPAEMHDVVSFTQLKNGRTRLTLRRGTPLSISKKYGETEGWGSSLDKFAKVVEGEAKKGV